MKQSLQNVYNTLRSSGFASDLANFFISRERAYRTWEQDVIQKVYSQTLKDEFGNMITSAGLFAGLKWSAVSKVGSEFAPKIVGTYERELTQVIEAWIKNPHLQAMLDIGAAEGYYAAGLAMVRPDLPVYAFESSVAAHSSIKGLAVLNHCEENLRIYGSFTPDSWDQLPEGKQMAILIDIDGGENEVCNSEFVRRAARSHLIIEVHDFIIPNMGSQIEQRFHCTHVTRRIYSSCRTLSDMPSCFSLTRKEWERATDEKRPMKSNYWIICDPRESNVTN